MGAGGGEARHPGGPTARLPLNPQRDDNLIARSLWCWSIFQRTAFTPIHNPRNAAPLSLCSILSLQLRAIFKLTTK